MVYDEVQQALEERLLEVPSIPEVDGTPAVVWEGSDFEPETGVAYFKVQFAPVEPQDFAMGADGSQRTTGLFFVTVCSPWGEGPQSASELAGEVMTVYKRGTYLAPKGGGEHRVAIRKVWREAGYADDAGWYCVPVMIDWYCFTESV
jgi:hypothetical protein